VPEQAVLPAFRVQEAPGGIDTCYSFAPGGGAGGGWYGGGGGAADCWDDASVATGGGGGGGSSLIPPGGSCTPMVGTGNGEIIIELNYAGLETQFSVLAEISVKNDVVLISSEGKFNYRIIDLNGRTVLTGHSVDQAEVSLAGFEGGIYIVSVKTDKGEWKEKLFY